MPTTETKTTDALKTVAARIDDWCRRFSETEKMLANDIAHPLESAVHVWGLQLLPGADMTEAEESLATATKGLATVRTLAAPLTTPAFLAMGPLQQGAIGKHIEHQMWLVKGAVHQTIEAVRRANMQMADRDEAVADGLLEADKFIVDKAPEIAGDIAAALAVNKQAGALVENLGKIALRGVTEVSHVAQGGRAGGLDQEIGSLQDKALDAAIDLAASFVPGESKTIRDALRNLGTSVVKSSLKAAKGKSGPELEAALLSGVTDGVLAGLEGLAKEIPGLRNDKVRQQLMAPLIKGVSGAAKAALKGSSVAQGFADGSLKGAASGATSFGKEKLVTTAAAHGAGPGLKPDDTRRMQDAWIKLFFGVDIHNVATES